MEEMLVKNVTIMKYSYRDGDKRVYAFEVMDKFDEPDEALRLDKMIKKADDLSQELVDFNQLWIKNSVII